MLIILNTEGTDATQSTRQYIELPRVLASLRKVCAGGLALASPDPPNRKLAASWLPVYKSW